MGKWQQAIALSNRVICPELGLVSIVLSTSRVSRFQAWFEQVLLKV